jgi:hypothetical protein
MMLGSGRAEGVNRLSAKTKQKLVNSNRHYFLLFITLNF